MQRAVFSIINYQFDKVQIDLEHHRDRNLNLKFDPKGVYSSSDQTFELIFDVQVINDEESIPFVMLRCKGLFKFENVTTFQDIPDFFYRNSIAILFPYLRSYLSLVTTQANVPGIILPTMNLSGLEEVLREHTTEK
jgi:preprotein translocase subunit SecB